MAGGKITSVGRWQGAFIEMVYKPAILSAAIFSAAWMNWASPPRSYPITEIPTAAKEAVITIWGKDSAFMQWKMGIFAHSVACFCEADNAYSVWFFEFCREVAEYSPRRKK